MRMIAIASEPLAEGFALLGFETVVSPDREAVETLLWGLQERQEKALIFLESGLLEGSTPALEDIRRRGGRIVLTEIPPLAAPERYRPAVEDLVVRVLGPAVLARKP
jgi:vacuolar-type H+-ATPase subunit F/Vma7